MTEKKNLTQKNRWHTSAYYYYNAIPCEYQDEQLSTKIAHYFMSCLMKHKQKWVRINEFYHYTSP